MHLGFPGHHPYSRPHYQHTVVPVDSRRSLAGVAVDSPVGEDSPVEETQVVVDTLVEMNSLVGVDNRVEGGILVVVDTLVADSLSMVDSGSLARSLVAP